MENTAQHTDGMGFTEYQWERMWNSETATGTVHRSADDSDWDTLYSKGIAAGMSEDEAVEYADAEF
jgi:hypothetical protein